MKTIKFISGNIFTTRSQTLVNTVNCVGVMGAGIALEFRFRHPDMYKKYVELCKQRKIEIGKLWIYNIPDKNEIILNFPTKIHWRYPSKIEYLEKGLQKFVDTYEERKITSIAFPLLGAQNGGIDPEISKKVMEKYLSKCDIEIEIYEYDEMMKDDLVNKLNDLFDYYDTEEIKKLLGIKSDALQSIRELILERKLNSLFQLTRSNIEGVNTRIIQRIYNYLMNYEIRAHSESLFDQSHVSESSSNVNIYKINSK